MPASEFFSWTFPGAPIRIDLDLNVVGRLKQEILRSGEVETGGILLGSTVPDSLRTVRITGFQPFPQEAVRYTLTDAERGVFAQTVSDLRQREDAMAVGYYRSHLREGLCLDPEDLALIRSCLPDASDVFLVMRREPQGEIAAGFFFWDDGNLNPDFSFLEFPLQADELREPRVSRTPAASGPSRWLRTRRHTKLLWGSLALGLLAIAGLVGLWLPRPTPRESPVPAQELGLQYEIRGPDVRITWDKSAPAVTAASVGMLSIRDGNREDTISLAPDQLRAGSVSYTYKPGSETIRFRMELVDHGGRELSQDLVAVVAQRPLVQAAPSPISVMAPPESLAESPAESTAESTADRRDTRPEPHPVKPFQAPRWPEKPPEGRAALLEPPPPWAAAQTPFPVEPATAAPGTRPGARFEMGTRSSLAQELLMDAPPPPEPPQPTARADEYIPPKPLRQVQPVLPPNIRSIVPRRMRVQVRVSIDQNGKIVSAEPVSAGPAPANLLGTLAANAARLWLFEPARSNSRAVASEVIVNFDFVPSPQR
jgi:hypothetical protein